MPRSLTPATLCPMKTALNGLLALIVLVAGGCTMAPELEKYPRAEIDRPYTLPLSVATWTTHAFAGYATDATGTESTLIPFPVPIFWSQALTDDWQLNWTPLPLSASHQFFNNDRGLLGTTFGMGFGYGSGTAVGLVVQPHVTVFYRKRLNPEMALEITPSFTAIMYSGSTSTGWAAGIRVGPLFQLSPLFAVRVGAMFAAANGYDSGIIRGAVKPGPGTTFTMPLDVGFTWSVARQWDFGTAYKLSTIGQPGGYQSHLLDLTLVHYW